MRSRSELIQDLSRDLRPAPRLRGPLQLTLLWWTGAWILAITATLAVAPLRPGVAAQLLASPRFALETLLGLVAGWLVVATAFEMGIPGSRSRTGLAALALTSLTLWVGGYVYGLHDPSLDPSMRGKRILCFAEVLIYGLPTLVAGLLLLRRLAPLERGSVGLAVGTAAGAIPALLMQIACMYVPAHVLTHHIAPIFALTLLGGLAGRALLRRV